MTTIVTYQPQYESEVRALLATIAAEFSTPISSPGATATLPPAHYWVALHNNKVAGTVGVDVRADNRAVLKRMFVDAAHRGAGEGISNRLLQTALDWCRANSIKQVYLGTMTQFKAAQRFYEKNGFRQIAKTALPADFTPNPVDDLFYHLNL